MFPLTRDRNRNRAVGDWPPTPSLDFQFLSGSLSPQITFTRASTATFFNSSGTLTSASNDVARFDFNPSTLAAQGLLIEESRTNSIRNNTMQDAVAGTPGTAPTNWLLPTPSNGLSRQIVGAGTENGINYVDIKYSGTTSAPSLTALYWETTTGVAASSGQTWTNSVYVAVVGGSTANITAVVVGMDENNSGGSFLVGGSTTFTPSSGALAGKRYSHTRTLNNASTAFVWPYVFFSYASGAAIDITLRIGLPQLEQGAFATSVIPTTTTALTRSQDRAVVNTLAPWYNSVAGTIYAEFALTQPVSGGNQFLARVSDNSYNNSIVDNVNGTGFATTATSSGGVFDGLASTAIAVSANTVAKFAGAYAANDLAACKDGGTVVTDNTATISSGMTRFDLGSDHAGLNNVKAGYLRRITYYPRRLANAELQAITL
jgi:hypothetical protein